VRQPIGVFACIAPFNFPAMVPLWFYPFAVACGDTFICKPSEQVPLSQKFIFELIHDAGFPPGVLNLVNGGKDVVNAICSHPLIRGVSFVGSSPVAEHVYKLSASHGKRVQALGGAKNFLIVMPDADRELTLRSVSESAYGCAGERCLAGAVVLAVGESHAWLREGLKKHAEALKVGDGSKDGITMGRVISESTREGRRATSRRASKEGAEIVLDGRKDERAEGGLLPRRDAVRQRAARDDDRARGDLRARAVLMQVGTLDDALEGRRRQPLANASSIFTTSGKSARKFKYNVEASMAGVNIGVAAPMSFFGFGGAKGSFFGDLEGSTGAPPRPSTFLQNTPRSDGSILAAPGS
jgi:malonate-semialdehyde dehydrogenase (acetylating)/methylmalonate-semialdehyde dehydrogenase